MELIFGLVLVHPGLGPVFRARHGSRIVCMSLTLSVDMNLTSEGTLLRIYAAIRIGSELNSLLST